jgi:tRNA A-37 threonylcarbamoyl transferase component Bud32
MKDIIAMRRLSGTCLADLILSRLSAGKTGELGRELEAFGKFLAEFHARHGMQHGDLQPANVIYNELSGQFSLIDVADMGNPRIKVTDAEHFLFGLHTMFKPHEARAFEECRERFEAGLNDATS